MVKKKTKRPGKSGTDLTIHFMPYSEIAHEDAIHRIKKIMGVVPQDMAFYEDLTADKFRAILAAFVLLLKLNITKISLVYVLFIGVTPSPPRI